MAEECYTRILKVLLERIGNKETSNPDLIALVNAVDVLIDCHRKDNYGTLTEMKKKLDEAEKKLAEKAEQ